jgi:Uma2 family endonuclease
MTIANRPSPTSAKSPQFKCFAEYLAADPADLPESRCEYWDGELVPVMAESIDNLAIANYLFAVLIQAGIPINCLYPHSCEIEVPGQPRSRYPDLTLIDEVHLRLLKKRATITRDMPPPRLLAEVVSPGSETSDNYKRDYQEKARQYAQIGVPEYWLIDPQRAVVLVGLWVGSSYQFAPFAGSQIIVSPTFPGLKLTAEQLLNAGV